MLYSFPISCELYHWFRVRILELSKLIFFRILILAPGVIPTMKTRVSGWLRPKRQAESRNEIFTAQNPLTCTFYTKMIFFIKQHQTQLWVLATYQFISLVKTMIKETIFRTGKKGYFYGLKILPNYLFSLQRALPGLNEILHTTSPVSGPRIQQALMSGRALPACLLAT